ncbi:MAG: YopX family protein [Candidatus Thorarchaeota archaeon]
MSKVLARGIDVKTDEWRYGSYLYDGWTDKHFIVDKIDFFKSKIQESKLVLHAHEVKPSTVGIFTGENDKNGKQIWEGDVIEWTHWECDTGNGKEGTITEIFVVQKKRSYFYPLNWLKSSTVKVIGNVYDNPEYAELKRIEQEGE